MELTDLMQTAKKQMLKHGGHHPTVIVETQEQVAFSILDFLPETTMEKKMLLFQIGHDLAMEHDIEAKDVTQLTWICEAWFSQMRTEEYTDTTPKPSQDPNRQEGLMVLMLTMKDKTLIQRMKMVEVIRHGDILDLVALDDEPDEVQSGFLTSCLAGICSAALSEDELTDIMKKAAEDSE